MSSTVIDCEGKVLAVSMTDEVSSAISSWAEVAELYERTTEMTLSILGEYFLTRNQFIAFGDEIKFYISKGLPEKDKALLIESSKYLNDRDKTPERKALAESRKIVKNRVLKIYNRLLQELFPSFLTRAETPPRVSSVREKKHKEDDDDTDELDEPEEPTDDEDDITEDGRRKLKRDVMDVAPQIRRARYANATRTLPQDLFETPENALLLLLPILATIIGKVIYEPCCGNSAITRFLESRGFTVISRDLFTTEEKHDYLTEEDPEYDVLITNPRMYLLNYFI